MGIIFMTISALMPGARKIDPNLKNAVVAKTFARKFCAEWSDREVHSSHGEHFRDNFYVHVSGQLSDNILATFDGSTFSEIYF